LLKPLRLDMAALEAAFDPSSPEDSAYLDLETGEVVTLTPGEVTRAIRAEPEDLAGWDPDRYELVRSVLARIGKRYRPVPVDEPADLWSDAQTFVEELPDPRLARRLASALAGTGPVHRFFRAVWDAEIADEWGTFVAERRRERIVGWLTGLGYSPYWSESEP
jgi:hypothetical protein